MNTCFILSIAGSDPCSGAGIQADIKVGYSLGAYMLTVITAVTVQNTQGVYQVIPMPKQVVMAQINKLLEEFSPRVIKIGLMPNIDVLTAILQRLEQVSVPIVLDPIFSPTRGCAFIDVEGIRRLRDCLPNITILTPNIPEAMQILAVHQRPRTQRELIDLAKELVALGVEHVVLKGGHFMGSSCSDVYVSEKKIAVVKAPRLVIENRHGSGCAFSSALAVYLAKDNTDVYQALGLAKQYQSNILAASMASSLGHDYQLLAH